MGCPLDHLLVARRAAIAVATLACGLVPQGARAQVSLGIGVGAAASSNLVTDSIVEAIAVRPQVAPRLVIRVETPLSGRYHVAGEVSVSRSNLMTHAKTESTKVTSLTLWSPCVALRAAATPWLGVEARLGALVYDPGETDGTLFGDGAPVLPTLGLGVRAERALGDRLVGSLQLHYDLHRFTTNTLATRGFTGETIVHRVALGVTLYRRLGRAPARD